MPNTRLFVVGDSISIDYGPYLQAYIRPFLDYARKTGEAEALLELDNPQGANGGDSSMVLDYLRGVERAGGLEADLLLLNCGLHDIKTDPATGAKQVPLDRYRDNLREILAAATRLGVKTVWVSTTPVDDAMHQARDCGFHRYLAEVRYYNQAAEGIMANVGIPVADLYAFTSTLTGEIFEDGVHFKEPVRALQAAFLAGWLQCYTEAAAASRNTSSTAFFH